MPRVKIQKISLKEAEEQFKKDPNLKIVLRRSDDNKGIVAIGRLPNNKIQHWPMDLKKLAKFPEGKGLAHVMLSESGWKIIEDNINGEFQSKSLPNLNTLDAMIQMATSKKSKQNFNQLVALLNTEIKGLNKTEVETKAEKKGPIVPLLVISTQSKSEEHRTGLTGNHIKEYTHGGLLYVHSNKQIRKEEAELAKTHLEHNSTVIITGHGEEEREGTKGIYIKEGQKGKEVVTDIEVSAEEFTKMLIASGAKNLNKPVNILLWSCYGGHSFSKSLAEQLSANGINFRIISSSEPVGRVFTKIDPQKPYYDFPAKAGTLSILSGGPNLKTKTTPISDKEEKIIVLRNGEVKLFKAEYQPQMNPQQAAEISQKTSVTRPRSTSPTRAPITPTSSAVIHAVLNNNAPVSTPPSIPLRPRSPALVSSEKKEIPLAEVKMPATEKSTLYFAMRYIQENGHRIESEWLNMGINAGMREGNSVLSVEDSKSNSNLCIVTLEPVHADDQTLESKTLQVEVPKSMILQYAKDELPNIMNRLAKPYDMGVGVTASFNRSVYILHLSHLPPEAQAEVLGKKDEVQLNGMLKSLNNRLKETENKGIGTDKEIEDKTRFEALKALVENEKVRKSQPVVETASRLKP